MANDAQREAAKDAVIHAVREILADARYETAGNAHGTWDWYRVDTELMQALGSAVLSLDALQSEPPAGASAEPGLPPRAAEWRARMSRVDAEGGC